MAAEIEAKFKGSWNYVKSENMEAFLDKLNVGTIKKKVALNLTPTITISVEGESISVSISALLKSQKATYKLGEEYPVEFEGDSGKAVTTFADGKMTTVVKPNDSSKPSQTVVREIVGGQLLQTMTADGVVAKRYFNKK